MIKKLMNDSDCGFLGLSNLRNSDHFKIGRIKLPEHIIYHNREPIGARESSVAEKSDMTGLILCFFTQKLSSKFSGPTPECAYVYTIRHLL